MIQADTSEAIYTRKIFRKASNETQSADRKILFEIANKIMSSTNNYSFRANIIAANYLAESSQISLPALIS
jgi:hypothetical protein